MSHPLYTREQADDVVAGAGLLLLAEYAGSNLPSVDALERNKNGKTGLPFQADFDDYELSVRYRPVVTGGAFRYRVSIDGVAFISAANTYTHQHMSNSNGASGVSGDPDGDTAIVLNPNATNGAGILQTLDLTISHPLSATYYKNVHGVGNMTDSTRSIGGLTMWVAGRYLGSANPVSGFQLSFSNGNIDYIVARLYGRAR